MKKIKVEFFSESKKWPRRIPKIKNITLKSIKKMRNYFNKNYFFNLNFVFSEKTKVSKLNKRYKNRYKDTDVLTFVSNISNKQLGKIFYCDIFFSIDTIEAFIKKNNVKFYDHLNHLIVHSLLHINNYDHKNLTQFKIMKLEEVKILNKIGIKDPYN